MCVFCKIIERQIPANIVFENETIIAFYDVAPQAKVHVLLVPKLHFANLENMQPAHLEQLTECFKQIPHIAKGLGLQKGYRLIVNNGEHAGQLVPHVHIHILGGQPLSENILPTA